MKKSIQKLIVSVAATMLASAASAAHYQLNTTGTFVPEFGAGATFGSSDPQPFNSSLLIDTNLGPLITYPAGTVLNPGAAVPFRLGEVMTLVSPALVTEFGATLGTGSWSGTDLRSLPFGTIDSFGVLISGSLQDGATPRAMFNAIDPVTRNEFIIGAYICLGVDPECLVSHSYSQGYEYYPSLVGDINNVVNTVTEVTVATTDELIDDAAAQIQDLVVEEAVVNVLSSYLNVAQKATADGNTKKLENSLNAMKNYVEAQRGKKISDADANTINSAIGSILDSTGS